MESFTSKIWVWVFAAALFTTALAQNGTNPLSPFRAGQKWQIILLGTPDMSRMPLPPSDAEVWDLDLFDNDASTFRMLKAAGKKVICYFSAGTWEDWRDDAKDFPQSDLGKVLPLWPNEKWIRTGSTKVREIMAKRVKLAYDKGCDAIDPDNTDGYQNDNGLNLRNTDLIEYMQWLQRTASSYGMRIGLKNSLDILPQLSPIMDFAVNEQCGSPEYNECSAYSAFVGSGKPVFHIEYPPSLNSSLANTPYCKALGTNGLSTILKDIGLDGRTFYCDGSQADTPVKGGTRPTPTRGPNPPRTTTRRPIPPPSSRTSSSRPVIPPTSRSTPTPSSTPVRPSTSPRPTTSARPSSVRSSSARPTSTPGGGGCRSKHWDQCGGNDWKGCTVCESPYQCKGVSPPYYYQCL